MHQNKNYNDRMFAPFILGALTGGLTYAVFNPYRPRPVYYQQPYTQTYPQSYGYTGYGGYYGGYYY